MLNSNVIRDIRNVWAVGHNYGEHAKELGNAVPSADSLPMIFLKAGSSIASSISDEENPIRLPEFTKSVHHEVEVALQFGHDLEFSGLTIAIDLTARDVQNESKANGHPWTLAKSFKNACLIGPIVPLQPGLNLQSLEFFLKNNGEIRQSGSTSAMIHSVAKIRKFILERLPVVPGDLLLTGTPAGVGQLKAGDRLEAEIVGHIRAAWQIAHSSVSG